MTNTSKHLNYIENTLIKDVSVLVDELITLVTEFRILMLESDYANKSEPSKTISETSKKAQS